MRVSASNPDRDQLERFLAHLKAGRKQQANEVIKEMLSTDPSKAGAYALLIGGMLAQNGQYDESIPLYEESIALDPHDPTAYFYLGIAHHALKNELECERAWDQLAARFPDHALMHYQLALRHLKRNEYEAAKQSLQNAVKSLEPDNPLRGDALQTLAAVNRELSRGI